MNNDPLSIADVLASIGPHPDLSPEEQIFAPFIGSWDPIVKWYERHVVTREKSGEWHFFWVLEGRAVQDIWNVPSRRERHSTGRLYEYGTSLRFCEKGTDGVWRSMWIGPMRQVVHIFNARRINGEVVLNTESFDGYPMRWVFSSIQTNRFNWRNEQQLDDEWVVTQTFAASRASYTVPASLDT